jgi:hypothetical protein
MLNKEAFISHILGEVPRVKTRSIKKDTGHIEGFDFADDAPDSEVIEETRFVTPLLQADFGEGQGIPRAAVIRSNDAVARYIPDEVRYWPKTPKRPHHTLLIEASLTHRELLAIPAFKTRQLAHLDIAEDALARLVAEALDGFQRGGESLGASTLKGQKHETLCIVSIIDERDGHAGRLACFGTFNAKTEGLETFFLTEHARVWDRADARERLGLIYERQFRKLGEASWQDAFTTTDERQQAKKLLDVCTREDVVEKEVQESILDLLDTIARGFGLRKSPDAERRLRAFPLPCEHDIGIDSEEREKKYGGTNPFSGVRLRDDQGRLLGYIVYPLKKKSDAEKLKQHLKNNNRFHNVLVVYPDANQASIELWQGSEQLIGKLRKGQSHKDAADVVNLLSRFFVVSNAKVRNPKELAHELAYRARYLRRLALKQLGDEQENGPLRDLYNAFKVALVHDQKEDEFADAFAQTITYGLLTARWLGNEQLSTAGARFTRQNALKYLPAASPFLNDLFKSVLSLELDEQRGRLFWLVDDVADLLDRIDVIYIFSANDKNSDTVTDPVIHFYEPFLAAYDKNLKNKRGVFFTPRVVVSYIVRAIHEMLQKEFGLEDGLASTDTWGDVAKRIHGLKFPDGIKASDIFVQVLDPATGTGTFIYEVIGIIEHTMKDRWCSELSVDSWSNEKVVARWNDYVPKYLLPRLHGFELMIASYAVAHLKLSSSLVQSGYCMSSDDRFNLFLTNSLEPASDLEQQELVGTFPALAHEARLADTSKRHSFFTVVLGNPPYAKAAQNKGPWIDGLMERYKTTIKKGEIQRQALSNDYVKFVCLASHLLRQASAGILGMITDNSYLDGPLFRDMRADLKSTFPRLRIANLHGNSRKGGETELDENIFDIQQGVAVILGATHSRQPHAIQYSEVIGERSLKYEWLRGNITTSEVLVDAQQPSFLFLPGFETGDAKISGWDSGITLPSLFSGGKRSGRALPFNGAALATRHDSLAIAFTKEELKEQLHDFFDMSRSRTELTERFGLCSTAHFNFDRARSELTYEEALESIAPVLYRPFDMRWVAYHPLLIGEPRPDVMSHLLKNNLALLTTRRVTGRAWDNAFITKGLVEYKAATHDRNTQVFPLYLYASALRSGSEVLFLDEGNRKTPNLDSNLAKFLKDQSGLDDPESILFYVYALFYSPTYRSRFQNLLSQDYPRILIPRKKVLATALVTFGRKLVDLHLMEPVANNDDMSVFDIHSRPLVEQVSFANNTVWIDRRRNVGFQGVTEDVWQFHIGGYQVCEKWLKDRKGRTLSKEEIENYQKIVVVLDETIRIMANIDDAIEQQGGWLEAFATEETA